MSAHKVHRHTLTLRLCHTNTHIGIYTSISEDLGELWTYSENPLLLIPLLLHTFILSGYNRTPHYPFSTPHPAGVPAHTALAMPALSQSDHWRYVGPGARDYQAVED